VARGPAPTSRCRDRSENRLTMSTMLSRSSSRMAIPSMESRRRGRTSGPMTARTLPAASVASGASSDSVLRASRSSSSRADYSMVIFSISGPSGASGSGRFPRIRSGSASRTREAGGQPVRLPVDRGRCALHRCRTPIAVFAGARLISSARRKVVKIGPRTRANSPGLEVEHGRSGDIGRHQSGVNWMRPNSHPRTGGQRSHQKRLGPRRATPSTSA